MFNFNKQVTLERSSHTYSSASVYKLAFALALLVWEEWQVCVAIALCYEQKMLHELVFKLLN